MAGETGVIIHRSEHIFDRMKTAPNRVRKHSPGPNPESMRLDWRATVNGTRKLIDRFMSKVDMSAGPDECWPFTAYVGDAGYGQFWNGTQLVKAHRFAFFLAHDREAVGDVDHTCHNGSGCPGGASCSHRACCNPLHLEDVSHAENVRRGMAGRSSADWKSHCPRGHGYSGENQYIDPKGHQRCRRCAADRYINRKAV